MPLLAALISRVQLPATRRRLASRGMFALYLWATGWVFGVLLLPSGVLPTRFEDAGTYFFAGKAALTGGDFYASPDYREWPVVATLWAPLAKLPPWTSVRVWDIGLALLVAAAFVLLWRRLHDDGLSPSRRWTVLVCLSPAAMMMFYLGQMSGFCFAVYAIGLTQLKRRPALAGLCLALMAAKPHLALLALPALLAAAPVAWLTFGAGLLCWPLASLLTAGPAKLVEYVTVLYHFRDTNVGLVTSSLSSLFPLSGLWHTAVQALLLLAYCALLVVLLRARWQRRPVSPGVTDAVTALAVATLPYALISDVLFIVPALLRLGVQPGRRARLALTFWWVLPWTAALLDPFGGGGLLSLLPPIVAAATLLRTPLGGPVSQPWLAEQVVPATAP